MRIFMYTRIISRAKFLSMEPKDFKRVVLELVDKVGKKEAIRQLVMAGVAPSTADKLARDDYPSEIGDLLGRAIQDAVNLPKKAI